MSSFLDFAPTALMGFEFVDETSNEVRRDFRKHRVFTIDPETAKDLDDALHVVKNEDGTFEVGVHIADVTHFVKVLFLPPRDSFVRWLTCAFVAQHGSGSRGEEASYDGLPRSARGADASSDS